LAPIVTSYKYNNIYTYNNNNIINLQDKVQH